MSETAKASIWGGASVLLFAGILFLQSAVSNSIQASDTSTGNPNLGIFLIVATIVLVAMFVLTATLFFKNMSLGLQKRRNQAG